MPIVIASKRGRGAREPTDGATLVDVTSRGPTPWVRFSPFYPHGGIPVPFSPGLQAQSVEGIWQGLKVFERADVDRSKLEITSMKGLKRSSRKYGRVLGHRAGLNGDRLLSYVGARRCIYLPAYRWVLDNRVQDLIDALRSMSAKSRVTLLDYTTNGDVDDPSRPLSHAALIESYVDGAWPTCDTEKVSNVR
jgi:hypothetical protein